MNESTLQLLFLLLLVRQEHGFIKDGNFYYQDVDHMPLDTNGEVGVFWSASHRTAKQCPFLKGGGQ